MKLYENTYQAKLASKFAAYYQVDLKHIETILQNLANVTHVKRLSFIDIESGLLLVAFCDNDYCIDDVTLCSVEIFRSTQRMLDAFSTDDNTSMEDILICTENDFCLTFPFKMLGNRDFLLEIEVESPIDTSARIRKNMTNVVKTLKATYV